MKMIDLLIIIGIASVFFNLVRIAMDLFGSFKRKKAYKHENNITSGYMECDGEVGYGLQNKWRF